jgi:hypothetical protein
LAEENDLINSDQRDLIGVGIGIGIAIGFDTRMIDSDTDSGTDSDSDREKERPGQPGSGLSPLARLRLSGMLAA